MWGSMNENVLHLIKIYKMQDLRDNKSGYFNVDEEWGININFIRILCEKCKSYEIIKR